MELLSKPVLRITGSWGFLSWLLFWNTILNNTQLTSSPLYYLSCNCTNTMGETPAGHMPGLPLACLSPCAITSLQWLLMWVLGCPQRSLVRAPISICTLHPEMGGQLVGERGSRQSHDPATVLSLLAHCWVGAS